MYAFCEHIGSEQAKRGIITSEAVVAASRKNEYHVRRRSSAGRNPVGGRFQLGRLRMSIQLDLTGQRFGRLTVIERCGTSKDGQKMYRCVCDCGNEKITKTGNLRSGHVKSCGCLNKEMTRKANRERNTRHGGCGTRLYGIWFDMRQRCNWEKSTSWANYGGRGIRVCDEWQADFVPFRDWALANGYRDDLTLDRIDVDGNYCPENCRWADLDEQNNNKRTCLYATIGGVTKSVTQWCKETGIPRHTAYSRIRRGWEPERAVTEPRDDTRAKEAANKAKYKPVIVDGRDWYESMTAAAEAIGSTQHAVSHAARSGYKTKGHTVEYA